MAPVSDETLAPVREAAVRVAASHGLEIFDLQFRRESIGWVLRVMVDRVSPPGAPGAAAGQGSPAAAARQGPPGLDGVVGIEDCQRVSRDLSALLDVEESLTAGISQAYTLEVSSPGLDRPLRGEADYRRFEGRLAKIVTRAPIDRQSHFAGRLAGVDEGHVVLIEGRRTHRVPLDAISRARLDVEF